MRLAVFTNQFPAPIATFFARDLRSLIEQGIEVDVYPLYPAEPAHWDLVPAILAETVLPRSRVHHATRTELVRSAFRPTDGRWAAFARESARITGDAVRFGATPSAKTAYAAAHAWHWARRHPEPVYDHVLAYWGNYAATSAYLFHRATHPQVPFSIFARARIDLYRDPVFLREKLLYADNIFLVCEYNRRVVERTFPDVYPRIGGKIHVHYSGLPLDQVEFVAGGRPAARVVAVGRLEALKGHSVLIRAVARLATADSPLELELVGAGEEEGPLRALAAELGVADRVTFRGHLPPAATIDAIRGATVLVHPPVERDAMPNVLKEALAVGTPAIASDLAGAPEILDQGRAGLLVPAGDVGALSDAIRRLLADSELRGRFAEAGRRHMETYFDLWRNGAALADRLRASRRGAPAELVHAG